MELEEIKAKLETLGVPVAYHHFAEPQTPPFIAFLESGGTVEGADNINLYRRTDIAIELYTLEKDVELERKVEKLFETEQLDKTADIYLKDEALQMVAYTFENITFIEEEE